MSEKRTKAETTASTDTPSPLKKKLKSDDEVIGGDVPSTDVVEENGNTEHSNGTSAETAEEKKDAASSWVPPPFGALCWVSIPALDVARSKKFYTEALNFKFKPIPESYSDDKIAMFEFNNSDTSLHGGICKAEKNLNPSAGTHLYFMVPNIEDVVAKIEAAGGKPLDEKGEHGLIQLFEDTEGNVHGIYQLKTA